MTDERTAQLLEHLKAFTSDVVDRHHEGTLNPPEAKLLIWREMGAALHSEARDYNQLVWLRVSNMPASTAVEIATAFGNVVVCNVLGAYTRPSTSTPSPPVASGSPAEMLADALGVAGTPTPKAAVGLPSQDEVAYLTVKVDSATQAASLVQDLVREGAVVRDWRYGCFG